MFKFRSVNNIVIAPARTGRDRRRRTAVIITAHTNRGRRSRRRPSERMLNIVVIKFKAPRIELMPAKCREKIAKSTEGPAWAILAANGG